MENTEYTKDYSDDSLWKKLGDYALVAGKEVVTKALTLYETLKDKDTPAWAKAVIVGSLGYFISPADAIPDVIPVVGFADDLGALAASLAAVAAHIKDEHVDFANATLKRWFGKPKKAAKKK
jgi:uncharacterized membrane protein YkvA (DUF1232 family)